jgi:hypothetical protein
VLAKVKPLSKAFLGLIILVLANLACSGMDDIVFTVTPTFANTPTSVLPTITLTPTEVLAKDTQTPEPTQEVADVSVGKIWCVSAVETVHLRPSPNTSGYPIQVLANGEQITDLGGRVENELGTWLYVSVGKNQGWINEKYLGDC